MERGHRRVLVGGAGKPAPVEVTDGSRDRDHVAKPVDGEHPGRRERKEPEDREGDQVDQDELVAQRQVEVRATPPEIGEQTERHKEVRRDVVVGGKQRDGRVRRGPMVERQLRRETGNLLEVEQRRGVSESLGAAQRSQVVDLVIEPREPEHDEGLCRDRRPATDRPEKRASAALADACSPDGLRGAVHGSGTNRPPWSARREMHAMRPDFWGRLPSTPLACPRTDGHKLLARLGVESNAHDVDSRQADGPGIRGRTQHDSRCPHRVDPDRQRASDTGTPGDARDSFRVTSPPLSATVARRGFRLSRFPR